MVGGLIIVPIVSRLSQSTLPDNVDYKFSCYHRSQTVEVMDNLGRN